MRGRGKVSLVVGRGRDGKETTGASGANVYVILPPT
jgi:hypothetical protein